MVTRGRSKPPLMDRLPPELAERLAASDRWFDRKKTAPSPLSRAFRRFKSREPDSVS